jgi:hypothetical protein
VTSLLGTLEDGAVQLSSSWIQKYQGQIVSGLFDYISTYATALPGLQGRLAKVVANGIKGSALDLYLLRARLQPAGYWDTQGFKLLQVGGKSVTVNPAGGIDELDEVESTWL